MTDFSALRDPGTGAELRVVGDELQSATGAVLPIVGGIPRFVSSENCARVVGDQWNRFPKTQLASHGGIAISGPRLERCMRGDLARLEGKRVREGGSGAGRFTEMLLKAGATLHSFDFSAAVEANPSNNGGSDRLTLVQADVRRIPFEPVSYWRFRGSLLMQRVIRRLSPVHFNFPTLGLADRTMHYEWGLLDTHDATDVCKHLRSPSAIRAGRAGAARRRRHPRLDRRQRRRGMVPQAGAMIGGAVLR